jgi:hypothetical protein
VFKISKDYFDIIEIKDAIMDSLKDNDEILKLIDNKDIYDSSDLPWTSIFPYIKIPKILTDVESFICFRVDIPSLVSKNDFLENVNVIVYTVSHNEHVRINIAGRKGTRYDNLGAEVKKSLNGLIGKWIGELWCVSDTEDILEKTYPCRILRFTTKDISRSQYE